MSHSELTADDLLRRATQLLGEQSPHAVRPPSLGSPETIRILVDDGGDGSAAEQLVVACRRRRGELDMVVGDVSQPVALVLVVLDAGCDNAAALRPIVEHHLRTVGRVALVCTKIDVFWQWPPMLAGYRDHLDPHRLCPLFAVASDAGDGPDSGLVALVEWLTTETADAAATSRAQLAMAAAALAGLTPDAEQISVRRRRRAQLVADRDRGRADRLSGLRAGLTACRGVCAGRVQARLRLVAAEALARAETVTTRQDAHLVAEWLTRTIGQCATGELAELHARTTRIRRVALLGVDAAQPPLHTPSPTSIGRALPRAGRGADDALVMVFGASTGLGVGRLVVSQLADAGLAGWMGTAATVVVGLAMALWVVRTRRRAALRTAMRTWVLDTCAEARARIEQTMVMVVNDVEPQVVALIARHYERSDRRVAQQVADVDAHLRALARRAELAPRADAVIRQISRSLAPEPRAERAERVDA